jgi:hypothetical protein
MAGRGDLKAGDLVIVSSDSTLWTDPWDVLSMDSSGSHYVSRDHTRDDVAMFLDRMEVRMIPWYKVLVAGRVCWCVRLDEAP